MNRTMNGLEMEIKSEDLNFIRHIATSRMARVDLCQWSRNGVKKTVAKKSLVTGDTLRFKKELSSEIAILLAMKHESIIEMLGYIHSDAEFGLVMRYYKFGSYHKAFIETNYENPRTEEEFAKLLPLKLRIMEEISSAMQYLHSARPKFVLHLDIKAENVLMDDDLHAKLTDFGLSEAKTVSRLSKQSSCVNTGEATKGTLFYISPEHLNDPRCKSTVKTDVYAFGILAWQIFTDSNPYEDICGNNASLVIHHVQSTGCRPSLELVPACTPAALIKTVIEESWNRDPQKRPIFAEILERTQQEILRVDNFQRGVGEAVESIKGMLHVPTDDSMPEAGGTVVGSAGSATPISWEIVSNGIQRRGGLSRLNYGEFPIMATTELYLRGFKVVWSCKAMCVKTGNSTEIKDKASPFGACETAVCRLIKDMIAKGIYPRPIDEDKMR